MHPIFATNAASGSKIIALNSKKRKQDPNAEVIVKKNVREHWTQEIPQVPIDSVKLVKTEFKSPMWQHFKLLAPDNCEEGKNNVFAVCNYCFEEAKEDSSVRFLVQYDSSTTKLKRHLCSCHPDIVLNELNLKTEDIVKNGNDKTLDEFLCDGSDQHAVDYTRWVVEECKPLDTCESKAFNRMMRGVKKGYKPLDRHTVTSKIGSITSFVVTILVLMVLGQCLAITSDHWSSLSDQSFLAITGTIYFIFLRFSNFNCTF